MIKQKTTAMQLQTPRVDLGNPITQSGTPIAMMPRLITRRDLRLIVPYTPQHILRLEKLGRFPRRVRVGANRVAWLQSEIEAWIAVRVAERRNAP